MNGGLPLQVTRRAVREISEASAWWDANRPEAPEAFREEIESAFELLRTYPSVGARASNTRLAGVRRIHLSRIRYHLYYRVILSEAVEILALWHTARGPGPGV
ncbi:MAG: type II toxin-antitoxin system RelE/ParE family toxin [Rubrobacter sp.]|nr:type II toxin-antitoxin system RelE/ParE family toxin [Rubrobacter sp.]